MGVTDDTQGDIVDVTDDKQRGIADVTDDTQGGGGGYSGRH